MAEPAKPLGENASIEGLDELLEVEAPDHVSMKDHDRVQEGLHDQQTEVIEDVVEDESGVQEPEEEVVHEVFDEKIYNEFWTTTEAAEQLGVSQRTIFKKLKDGSLQGVKIPGKFRPEWRIEPVDIDPVTTETSKSENSKSKTESDHEVVHEGVHEHQNIQRLVRYKNYQFEELLELIREKDDILQKVIHRNGFLEGKLEEKDGEVKLLVDKQNSELPVLQEQVQEAEKLKIELQEHIHEEEKLKEKIDELEENLRLYKVSWNQKLWRWFIGKGPKSNS